MKEIAFVPLAVTFSCTADDEILDQLVLLYEKPRSLLRHTLQITGPAPKIQIEVESRYRWISRGPFNIDCIVIMESKIR